MTPNVVAGAVRHWRPDRDVSQRALAQRAGLTFVRVARLETAQSDPRRSTLVKLANALRIRVVDLLTKPKSQQRTRER